MERPCSNDSLDLFLLKVDEKPVRRDLEAETRDSELNLHPKGLREFLLTGGRTEGKARREHPVSG